MSKMYLKLAITNISKNKILYIPFILSGIMMTAFNYLMSFIAGNDGLRTVPGADAMQQIMYLGMIIITIFSYIFIFYTNSFLIKRRKKEFGVYNMLGMEKRHIGRVITLETALVAIISIVGGLLAGVLFSKLLMMLLLRLIHVQTSFAFYFSWEMVRNTGFIYLVLFLIIMVWNRMQVQFTKTIDLIKGDKVGEREPQAKVLLSLIGFGFLFAGYYISITTTNPLSAIMLFFVAVLFVILGTYILFTTGSIFILKLLKKNKKFYYNRRHMTAVSGMLYRMKQNAAGLANICILSTMVLVTMSTTVSLYAGMEDVVNTRYPYEIDFTVRNPEIEPLSEKAQAEIENSIANHNLTVKQKVVGREFLLLSAADLANVTPADKFFEMSGSMGSTVYVISKKDFLASHTDFEGEIPDLEDGQVYLAGSKVSELKSLEIAGEIAEVVGASYYVDKSNDYMLGLSDGEYFLVVKDEEAFDRYYTKVKEYEAENETAYPTNITSFYYYDLSGKAEDKLACGEEMRVLTDDETARSVGFYSEETAYVMCESRETNRGEFYILYGGLLFLGIACGCMFLVVTVMIIFYKQISEGYDDKERFQIMEKVGMSASEVKKTINTQVRMVFFLPLLVSFCHLAGAFPIVRRMLNLLLLSNTPLFVLCLIVTSIMFAVIYYIVFKITSKSYYKIVR